MIFRLSALLGAILIGLTLGGTAPSCSEIPEQSPQAQSPETSPDASPFDRLPGWVSRRPYRICARSRSELRQALRDSLAAIPGQPGDRHFGAVTASRYSFETLGSREKIGHLTADSCQCTAAERLQVRLEITMHYPIWTDMEACSDEALTADWQAYVGAVFLHELGHLHIARAGLVHLRTQLAALETVRWAPTCTEACAAARSEISRHREQAIDRLVKEIEAAHTAYDQRTDHGRAQGAQF